MGIEPAAIRLQLERLLASPSLRNSRRCQALLRHVVEAYLEGCLDQVKERTIGIEVFHREPHYDTNQDSVVRTTAAEIRKRLAQYYLEPDHRHELQVSLPQGSYLPEFHLTAAEIQPVALKRNRSAWILGALTFLVFATGGAWLLTRMHGNELDQLWDPLIEDRSDAVLCIGQPTRVYTFDGPRADALNQAMVGNGATPPPAPENRGGTGLSLADLTAVGARYYAAGDVMAAIRISELLARKRKAFRVLGDRSAAYEDLRGHPAVLIGQFNNRWTLGLTGGLRYYIERNDATRSYEVRDHLNPGSPVGTVPRSANHPEEFALVSRIYDHSTERAVIAVAGMTYTGTVAAADFLTNPVYVREALAKTSGWRNRNVQVVLRTTLVNGTAGPPRVVAVHVW